jgi:adenosine deaminase
MRQTPPADADNAWKDALARYFREFTAFFFPAIHAEVDWRRGYEFLDKELAQVMRDAATGRRLADKLVKVYLADGSEKWLLVHVEVQGARAAASRCGCTPTTTGFSTSTGARS